MGLLDVLGIIVGDRGVEPHAQGDIDGRVGGPVADPTAIGEAGIAS